MNLLPYMSFLHEFAKASEMVLHILDKQIKANTFFVAISDKKQNMIFRSLNKDRILVNQGATLPFLTTLCSTVIPENQMPGPIIIQNVQDHPLTQSLAITKELGKCSFIGVPIQLMDGSTVGTLCGLDHQDYPFQEIELELLFVMAGLLKYTIELERKILFDSLTGLMKKEAFLEMCEAFLSSNNSGSAALAFIDVDNFKQINDEFGHLTGDDLLKTVGERIAQSISRDDFAGRFAGDEFLVMIEDEHRSEKVLAKIKERLAEPVVVDKNQIMLSVSTGTSYYPRDGVDVSVLVHKADQSMYADKAFKNSVMKRGSQRYSTAAFTWRRRSL